ncbi:MAG: O-antigen ligase family protein, partial [Anaerolineales bacterium]|nr:O-antigen ligase family protein [Anaerolineales bacterium]
LDNGRAALLLTTADPTEDYIHTELVAENLAAGPHTMTIIADRGWDQWALKGFSVGYQPYKRPYQTTMALLIGAAIISAIATIYVARQANWQATSVGRIGRGLKQSQERLIAISLAILIALTGWLTWGAQAAGVYRRLDDTVQFALVAGSAAIFYITPWLFVYLAALLCFFLFVYARPSWGVTIIAFSLPFYVPQLLKPIYVYRFSPVEIFTLVTFAAVVLATITQWRQEINTQGLDAFRQQLSGKLSNYDAAVGLFFTVATLSLLFTERLDVATNEWRLVILEPILLYVIIRLIKPRSAELWRILDGFVLGGVAVALIGLWQYATGSNLIEAEAGLMRLRSIYGSPNNVALYLGRVLPLLVAMFLMGQATNQTRRWLYSAAAVPVSLAILLSFSKGALLLGVPMMLLFLFVFWQHKNERRIWPWLATAAILAVVGYVAALQIPQLAGRLDLTSDTGVFRLNLWRSSLNMIREHPWFGVGLDNFLYAYRGRYILAEAWQEPNLNHPHNLVLDFATRLGILGLLSGLFLFGLTFKALWHAYKRQTAAWQPAVLGFAGAMVHTITHGIVDHSFFLVDLAFAFFLIFTIAIQLEKTTTSD